MTSDEFIYQAFIDGDEGNPVEIRTEDLTGADILRVARSSLHVLDGSHSRMFEILKADYTAKEFVLQIDGQVIHIRLRDPVESRVHAMGFDVNRDHARPKHIASPMPGLVLKVLVSEGDTVLEGQPVIVLEAMKMENVLSAPADGVVQKILAEAQRNVDKGQILVELA